MQMKKEYSEPGEYDFFPETYVLPQELAEYRKQFQLSHQIAAENPDGANDTNGLSNNNQQRECNDKSYLRQTGRYKQNSMQIRTNNKN